LIIIRFGQGERDTQHLVGNELRFAPVWRQPAIGTGLHETGGAQNLSPLRVLGERSKDDRNLLLRERIGDPA